MKQRKTSPIRIIAIIILTLLLIAGLLTASYYYILYRGRDKISDSNTQKPSLPDSFITDMQSDGEDSADITEDDSGKVIDSPETTLKERNPDADVYYNGEPYAYRDDLINIAVMGIDKLSDEAGARAQADTVALISYSEKDKYAHIIFVPRDTICDVDILDLEGNSLGKRKLQLALAYSYGKDDEESAQLTTDALSGLFYGLPIHVWAAVYMDAVPAVNDAVGDVTIILSADADEYGDKGDTLIINKDNALPFLRSRDSSVTESTLDRLQNQILYVRALFSQVKSSVKKNPLIITELCSILFKHSTTNLGFDSAVYLATKAIKIDDISFESIEGTLVSAVPWAEFHADTTALYQMILKNFYKPLESENQK